MSTPLNDQQLAVIEATIRGFIPGIQNDSAVNVTITEQEADGLRNSWTGPVSLVVGQIEDRMLMASAKPSPEQPTTEIEAGRAAVRARFAGGAFPAALGQAIADELADVAMAPALAEATRLRAELEQARAEGRAQVIAELRTRATGPMLHRVLDEVAEMFASQPEPMHQSHCVAATQGCCSCEEPA